MKIDEIQNGIVLDHIKAGRGMRVYHTLRLDTLDCTVAIIKNVKSEKMGKKDIIKVDEAIDIDLDALGFIDPNITINIIRDGELVEKRCLCAPERLVNVIRCKNPRCITSSEQEIDQIFLLRDAEKLTYRCIYCEAAYRGKES
ncbi:MAG: aspartate carbamoyltransferase regulatory subunit [Oscillospiraceae bacterium]|jgi:aspartate carbamoyltransferase regulatory subunit|nr:aspartate carbamoyltransferase regulatory subunit [Oscillospiraceae bacterium]